MLSSKNRWRQEDDSGTNEERPFKRTKFHDAIVTVSHGSQDDLRSREQVKAVPDDYSGIQSDMVRDHKLFMSAQGDVPLSGTQLVRPWDVPDAVEYLETVKAGLSQEPAAFRQFLDHVRDWYGCDGSIMVIDNLIEKVSALLKDKPSLLQDFNSLLWTKHYRIGCQTDVEEVDLITVTTPTGVRIQGTSGYRLIPPPPYVTTSKDLRRLLSSEHDWEKLTLLEHSWASCVLQLLQTELDDEHVEQGYRRKCLQCLRRLVRHSGELPPSFFLRNVVRESMNPVQGGGFANIWKGHLGQHSVCLKVLRVFGTDGITAKVLQPFCHEAVVWRQLSHPNVLPFFGVNKTLFSPSLCFISPWMHHGHIMDYLKMHPDHDRVASIRQIAEGLRYLHELDPRIVHGDIKGANILVKDDLSCCLADFGLASIIESQNVNPTTSQLTRGTVRWMAPELMNPALLPGRDSQAKTSTDIYSFGCTIFEILTGKPPFSDYKREIQVTIAVIAGKRPSRPQPELYFPDFLWNLVESCWAQRPEARPTVQHVAEVLENTLDAQMKPSRPIIETTCPANDFSMLNMHTEDWFRREVTDTSTLERVPHIPPALQLAPQHDCWELIDESPTTPTLTISEILPLHGVNPSGLSSHSFDCAFTPWGQSPSSDGMRISLPPISLFSSASYPLFQLSPALRSSFSPLYNMDVFDEDEYLNHGLKPTRILELHLSDDLKVGYIRDILATFQYVPADMLLALAHMVVQSIDSSDVVYQAACLLSSVYRSYMCQDQGDDVEIQARYASLRPLLNKPIYTIDDAVAALHVISSNLFVGEGAWRDWFNVIYAFADGILRNPRYHGLGPAKILLECDEKLRYLLKTTMWFDVLESTSLLQTPHFLAEFRQLFAPSNVRNLASSSPPQLSMMPVMGCENYIVWAMAEVSNLIAWKQAHPRACLSVRELVNRGMKIEQHILCSPGPQPPPENDTDDRIISDVVRASTRVYLHSVLSDSHPSCPDIMEGIQETISCLKRVPVSCSFMRSAVFGIFICGCLTDDSVQREYLLSRLTGSLWNFDAVKSLMIEVWADRDQSTSKDEPVQWQRLLKQSGILLV